MGGMKDYFGSLFSGRKADDAAKPSIKNLQAEIPRWEESGGPSDRRKVYERGDIIAGKYEVCDTLGEGGFGLVYSAYHRDTNSVVAMKTFRDEFLADGKAREAFKKEVLLWKSLDEHPFVLAARWVDEPAGRLFVAMDYVAPDQRKQVNLADHIRHASGPIDTETALRWAIQFCYGMEHVNSHGIKCHRDIKPTNILITQDGTLKIADFGLAAAAEIAWEGRGVSFVTSGKDGRPGYSLLATEGKSICGTPGYIPPEIYRGERADVRSDIFSFGLVLWQMASGSLTPPFYVPARGRDEEHIRQQLKAIYNEQMTGQVPFVDSPMKSIIERCLTIEPSKRHANFTDLRGQLASIYYSLTRRTVEVPPVGEKTSEFWNNKGASLNSLGRYDEGIACLDKALEIDPRYTYAWNNKGISFASLGRHDEAIGCFNKALEIDSRYAAAYAASRNDKGINLHSLDLYDEGMGGVQKALERVQRYAYVLGNKGNSLNSLGCYDEAIDCSNKALEMAPRLASAWCNKGIGLASLGRYDEAVGCLNKTLEIDLRNTVAWYNKGFILRSLGHYEEAIDCYSKALDIDPRFAAAWNEKGINLHSLGRYGEALDCFNKALEIDPRNDIACFNKGLSLGSLGRHDEAIDYYNKALDIDPRYVDALNNKGASLNSIGHYDEAIGCLNLALEIEPRLVHAWNNKSISLRFLGRYDEAIDCCDKALEIDARFAITWFGKGASLAYLGRYGEALDCFNKALEIDPRYAEALECKALAEQILDRKHG